MGGRGGRTLSWMGKGGGGVGPGGGGGYDMLWIGLGGGGV